VAGDLDLKLRLLGDSSDLDAAVRDGEKSVDRLGTVMAGLGVTGAAGGAALAVGFARTADLEEGTARLQAQLGLTAEDAAAAGELAGSVYASNFGVDMLQVNDAIKSVTLNLGDIKTVGEESFRGATEAALTLADVMGVDVAESTQAAAALVKNGLARDSEEAFDLIATGFQDGADKADDFLETITEYSPQFAKWGLDGSEAFALISSGIKAGARDTDVLADSFKEFNLLALDAGSTAPAGFKALGMNAAQASADIAAGGDRAQAALMETVRALAAMEDPQAQNTAGVALFGTTWEDTMRQVLPAIAATSLETESAAGSIDQMTAAMGGTGKARVETLRREFDAWVQSQVNSSGASSTAVAAIGSFGPAALGAAGSLGAMVSGLAALNIGAAVARVGQLAASAATAAWTGAQWLLNVALTANPIGLVILAIGAIVAAIVIAYKKSETFRMIVQMLWATIKAGAAMAWNALKAFGASFAGWVSGLISRGKGIIDWFRGLPAMVRGALGDARSLLSQKGRDMVTGLWNGIKDMGGWIRDRVSGFIQDTIIGPIQRALQFGSPSKVARQWGRWTGEGLGLGLADSTASVTSASSSLASAATPRPVRGAGTANGGGAVHIHTPAVVTSDRQLVQLIDRAERGTARTRTFARAGA
jgi:phage-related minor tail protein